MKKTGKIYYNLKRIFFYVLSGAKCQEKSYWPICCCFLWAEWPLRTSAAQWSRLSTTPRFSHIHERISEIRIESCASRCDADPYCYSFSFFLPSKTCELNNATSLTDSKNFQSMPGAVYFKRLQPPHDFWEALPCQNNGTCKILDHAPGFEYSCPTEYSGETCESE